MALLRCAVQTVPGVRIPPLRFGKPRMARKSPVVEAGLRRLWREFGGKSGANSSSAEGAEGIGAPRVTERPCCTVCRIGASRVPEIRLGSNADAGEGDALEGPPDK